MKLAAYVLLGDPAWLVPSIRSYYDHVERIIASFDEGFRSWAGADMRPEMEACIRLLGEHDPSNKVVLLPGAFANPGQHPQLGETQQRQASIRAASEFGDWVLQLDTDEIVQDPRFLIDQIEAAATTGFDGLEYPARWIYAHIRGQWFLERATRRFRTWDAIPGPVAVRPDVTLRLARQGDFSSRRLRISNSQREDAVPLNKTILHFSMVRSAAAMHRKATLSPHAPDLDWKLRLGLWEEANTRPIRAVVRSFTQPTFGTYLPCRLPAKFGATVVEAEIRAGDPSHLRSAG